MSCERFAVYRSFSIRPWPSPSPTREEEDAKKPPCKFDPLIRGSNLRKRAVVQRTPKLSSERETLSLPDPVRSQPHTHGNVGAVNYKGLSIPQSLWHRALGPFLSLSIERSLTSSPTAGRLTYRPGATIDGASPVMIRR